MIQMAIIKTDRRPDRAISCLIDFMKSNNLEVELETRLFRVKRFETRSGTLNLDNYNELMQALALHDSLFMIETTHARRRQAHLALNIPGITRFPYYVSENSSHTQRRPQVLDPYTHKGIVMDATRVLNRIKSGERCQTTIINRRHYARCRVCECRSVYKSELSDKSNIRAIIEVIYKDQVRAYRRSVR